MPTDAAPAAPAGTAPASATPTATATALPRRTPAPGPELIRPLEGAVEVVTADEGLMLFQPASGERWSSLEGDSPPRPIRFEDGELVVRIAERLLL